MRLRRQLSRCGAQRVAVTWFSLPRSISGVLSVGSVRLTAGHAGRQPDISHSQGHRKLTGSGLPDHAPSTRNNLASSRQCLRYRSRPSVVPAPHTRGLVGESPRQGHWRPTTQPPHEVAPSVVKVRRPARRCGAWNCPVRRSSVRRVTDAELVGLDLSSWSMAFNGSEPVRAETLNRFAARVAR